MKDAPFAHEKIRYVAGIYFHRNVITTAEHVVMVEAIKHLGKYISCIWHCGCEKTAIYMCQNSILILYVPFVNCCQFMYLIISLLLAGHWIWLYQFLIIAYF